MGAIKFVSHDPPFRQREHDAWHQDGRRRMRDTSAWSNGIIGTRPVASPIPSRGFVCGHILDETDIDRALAAGIPRIRHLLEADALPFPELVEARLGQRRVMEKQVTAPCAIRHDEPKSAISQAAN